MINNSDTVRIKRYRKGEKEAMKKENIGGICWKKRKMISPGNRGGRDSSVGIATGYGLDGPGIESRFFANVQTGPEAHPASCTMGIGSFPGLKRPGRGADHPPPSSAEVKKE
jgi:hypothetical protein